MEKNFDDDAAQVLAQSKASLEALTAEVELLKFERTNRAVLEQYADAEKDIALIAARVKATGMTVEQICHGMYDALEPEEVRRQKASATGKLGGNKKSDFSVAGAVTGGKAAKAVTLTASQQRMYDQLKALGIPNLTKEEVSRLNT